LSWATASSAHRSDSLGSLVELGLALAVAVPLGSPSEGKSNIHSLSAVSSNKDRALAEDAFDEQGAFGAPETFPATAFSMLRDTSPNW
jgi:hypothetical protein